MPEERDETTLHTNMDSHMAHIHWANNLEYFSICKCFAYGHPYHRLEKHFLPQVSGATEYYWCRLSPYIPKLSYPTIIPTCIIPALDTNSIRPPCVVLYDIVPAITLYPKMHSVYTLNTSYFYGKTSLEVEKNDGGPKHILTTIEGLPRIHSIVSTMIVIHSTFHLVGSTSAPNMRNTNCTLIQSNFTWWS